MLVTDAAVTAGAGLFLLKQETEREGEEKEGRRGQSEYF